MVQYSYRAEELSLGSITLTMPSGESQRMRQGTRHFASMSIYSNVLRFLFRDMGPHRRLVMETTLEGLEGAGHVPTPDGRNEVGLCVGAERDTWTEGLFIPGSSCITHILIYLFQPRTWLSTTPLSRNIEVGLLFQIAQLSI